MKHLNRILAIALAAILLLGTFTTVFATQTGENEETEANELGTITLTGVTLKKTYNLYRVFNLTYTGEAGDKENPLRVAYTINADWEDFFADDGDGKGYLIDAAQKKALEDKLNEDNGEGDEKKTLDLSTIVVDNEVKYIYITENNRSEFAQVALPYAVKVDPVASKEAKGGIVNEQVEDEDDVEANYSLTFKDLELGYYLVYPVGATDKLDSQGSLCSLTNTIPNGEIVIKATWPTVEKTMDGGLKVEGVDVGQKIEFEVKGQVPDITGFTDFYTYKLSDTLSEGLTLDQNSVAVYILKETETETETKVRVSLVKDIHYDISTTENGFELDINMLRLVRGEKSAENEKPSIVALASPGDTILVQYSGSVNEKGLTKVSENEVTLTYSNNPSVATETEEFKDQTYVYNAKIVIDKYENGNPTKKLPGAEFVLTKTEIEMGEELLSVGVGKTYFAKHITKNEEGNTNPVPRIEWTENMDEATVFGTDEKGAVDIQGLAPGGYLLIETKAPDGYNLLDEPVEVIIPELTEEEARELYEAQKEDAGTAMETLTATAEVANSSGSELPGTGGTGTTIFYVVGGLLVAGAVVLLVTKKRMSAQG